MKKKLLILIACIVLVATVLSLVACSENTKQEPIPTDLNGAKVSDNGGMAVKYGNYIYFINGFAGETALNTYGDVVRGAICRTTLNSNGEPDYKSVKTIVSKNAFGEDKTYGGIYIVNDYIYYNTTSIDKNSKREYKSTEGVLMRTKIDGSVTETVKELDDNDISLYAGDNSKYLAYAYDNCLYTLNAETNEIKHITESNAKEQSDSNKGYVAYKYYGDFVFYTMYNYEFEDTYSQDYFLYMCDLRNGKVTKLASSDIYNGNTERSILYTTTILNATINGDEITLFYSKKDNKTNATTTYCSLKINAADPKYVKENEVVYEYATSYTAFYKLNNGYVLGFNASKFDVFNADGTKVKKADGDYDVTTESPNLTLDFTATVTIVDVVETETEVYAIYLADSTFIYCKLFNKTINGDTTTYSVAKENIVKFSKVGYDTSYVTYDIIENVLYYINKDIQTNAYYYMIPAFDGEIDTNSIAKGKILGIIKQEDVLNAIIKTESEENK